MLILMIIIPLFGIAMIATMSDKLALRSERNGNFVADSTTWYNTKIVALFITLVNFFISIILWAEFDSNITDYQFVWPNAFGQEDVNLYPQCSAEKHLVGVDGISLYFIILTTFITPICILSNWDNIKHNMKYYLIAFLLLETLLIAVFSVCDLLLFYVFFESVLIPLFYVVGVWGGSSNRVRAAFLLFLYTLFGSLFMLLAFMVIYYNVGSTDFLVLSIIDINLDSQKMLWLAIFISIAVKTPLMPFNTWLTYAHAEAPVGGSIMLAGVILKLATYGYMRIMLQILPDASYHFSPLVQTFCVITIIYASLATLTQTDFKKIIAYSSVAHMGVVVLGLFSNTVQGIEGAIMLSIGHGFVSPALFFLVGGVLYDRYHTRVIRYYRGITVYMPLFSILFFVFTISNAAVPLTANWVGEVIALTGAFYQNIFSGVLGASGIVLSAAYSIWLYNRIAFGSWNPSLQGDTSALPTDIGRREFIILLVLLIGTVVLGVFPNIVLDTIHVAVSQLMYTESGFELFGLQNHNLASVGFIISLAIKPVSPGPIFRHFGSNVMIKIEIINISIMFKVIAYILNAGYSKVVIHYLVYTFFHFCFSYYANIDTSTVFVSSSDTQGEQDINTNSSTKPSNNIGESPNNDNQGNNPQPVNSQNFDNNVSKANTTSQENNSTSKTDGAIDVTENLRRLYSDTGSFGRAYAESHYNNPDISGSAAASYATANFVHYGGPLVGPTTTSVVAAASYIARDIIGGAPREYPFDPVPLEYPTQPTEIPVEGRPSTPGPTNSFHYSLIACGYANNTYNKLMNYLIGTSDLDWGMVSAFKVMNYLNSELKYATFSLVKIVLFFYLLKSLWMISVKYFPEWINYFMKGIPEKVNSQEYLNIASIVMYCYVFFLVIQIFLIIHTISYFIIPIDIMEHYDKILSSYYNTNYTASFKVGGYSVERLINYVFCIVIAIIPWFYVRSINRLELTLKYKYVMVIMYFIIGILVWFNLVVVISVLPKPGSDQVIYTAMILFEFQNIVRIAMVQITYLLGSTLIFISVVSNKYIIPSSKIYLDMKKVIIATGYTIIIHSCVSLIFGVIWLNTHNFSPAILALCQG